jgi:hypothetical protein
MLRISVAVESGKSKAELNAFLNDINEGKIKIEKEVLNIQYWLQNKLQSAK